MFKKGQAALEFLTTYGWAFLVILVMIGALAYFGVLNPSKFVPDTCTFSSTFLCDDAVINTTTVSMKMRNNIQAINITSIKVTDVDSGNASIAAYSQQIGAGEVFTLTAGKPLAAIWDVGNKKKLAVDISYFVTASGTAFGKSTGGDIVGTIQ